MFTSILDPSAKEAANRNAFEKTLQGIKHNERTAEESHESVRFISKINFFCLLILNFIRIFNFNGFFIIKI